MKITQVGGLRAGKREAKVQARRRLLGPVAGLSYTFLLRRVPGY